METTTVKETINFLIKNKELVNLISFFNQLNGSTFVGIRNYNSSTTDEIANYTINCGLSYKKVLERDFRKIATLGSNQFMEMVGKLKKKYPEISALFVYKIIKEMEQSKIDSINTLNNILSEKESNYINLNNAIKFHDVYSSFYLYGYATSKKLIFEGNKKQRNHSIKTLIKKFIEKELNLISPKYRQFSITNGMTVVVGGKEFKL